MRRPHWSLAGGWFTAVQEADAGVCTICVRKASEA